MASASKCEALRQAGCEVFICDGETRESQFRSLLDELGRRRYTNVLVEGGASVFGTMLDINEINEFHAFVAAKLLGGSESPSAFGGLGFERPAESPELWIESLTSLGEDIHVHGFVTHAASEESA